jgi:hypothetical protein
MNYAEAEFFSKDEMELVLALRYASPASSLYTIAKAVGHKWQDVAQALQPAAELVAKGGQFVGDLKAHGLKVLADRGYFLPDGSFNWDKIPASKNDIKQKTDEIMASAADNGPESPLDNMVDTNKDQAPEAVIVPTEGLDTHDPRFPVYPPLPDPPVPAQKKRGPKPGFHKAAKKVEKASPIPVGACDEPVERGPKMPRSLLSVDVRSLADAVQHHGASVVQYSYDKCNGYERVRLEIVLGRIPDANC